MARSYSHPHCHGRFGGLIFHSTMHSTVWLSLYRRQQCEYDLSSCVSDMLDREQIRKTSYHPASSGLAKCFHRQPKSALKSQEKPDWCKTFPLFLLAIRICLKAVIQCSAAELVLGMTLRLLGESFVLCSPDSLAVQIYAARLSMYMRNMFPVHTHLQR